VIVDPSVERYLDRMQQPDDAVLDEMGRLGEERGFPIVGPLVGRILELLARASGARRVFEMGSGFGYSTAWYARAVGDGGRVVHTETDRRLSDEARQWLAKAGLADRVDFRLGDALDVLRQEKGPWDVVFIDIEKQDYPEAWRLARDRVRPGGMVVTDNALWKGKVAGKARDADTEAIREYNRLAEDDPDFLVTILPVRDGVSVALRLA
jgi:caffeoyl-CoA O-methyltransferase